MWLSSLHFSQNLELIRWESFWVVLFCGMELQFYLIKHYICVILSTFQLLSGQKLLFDFKKYIKILSLRKTISEKILKSLSKLTKYDDNYCEKCNLPNSITTHTYFKKFFQLYVSWEFRSCSSAYNHSLMRAFVAFLKCIYVWNINCSTNKLVPVMGNSNNKCPLCEYPIFQKCNYVIFCTEMKLHRS